MVFVGNLAYSARWKELKEHMSLAGPVAFARILTEDGSDWGRSKGIAVVRYETPAGAQQALATLLDSTFKGRNIQVDHWTGNPAAGKLNKWGAGFEVHGDPATLIYVGNLAYKTRGWKLKEHMAQAGEVEFCRILTETKLVNWGQSRGAACVRYASAAEADKAIEMLHQSTVDDRAVNVDRWVRREEREDDTGSFEVKL